MSTVMETEAPDNLSQGVYVVVAYDTDTERFTCFNVLTDVWRARRVQGELGIVYGASNVSLASVRVDAINMGAPITLSDL